MKRTAALLAFGIAALTSLGIVALLNNGTVSAGSGDVYIRIESQQKPCN